MASKQEWTMADKVKIACAHLVNTVQGAMEQGYQVKQASQEGEINSDVIEKIAKIMVIDHYDLINKVEAEKINSWLTGK